MATQDQAQNEQMQKNAATEPEEAAQPAGQESGETPTTNAMQTVPDKPDSQAGAASAAKLDVKRVRRITQARVAASLHKIRLTRALADTTVPAGTNSVDTTEPAVTIPAGKSKRKARKDRLQDWDTWSRFRLWRNTRPFWGSTFMFLSSLILLGLPLYFLQFAFILNSLWASILIGALLLVMALVQLFVPSYSVLTGSIGIVLSLVSFITSSFGGCLIGMLLGIIGGTLSLAWRPVGRSRLVATRSSTNS
ncbi:MAG TPA: DUF6114 domain-containing protein [Ktedonobacteraceae bacterium]|nr:DUF6114 domain-containing protein [Ktedonobacteraceae bacterium]